MAQAEQERDTAQNGQAVALETPPQRLLSLDALRGFTMFWITGGREFVLAAAACWWPHHYDAIETQLTHPRWEGFVVWDMVMPVFLFVVGVAIPMSLAKRVVPGQPLGPTYRRIARRVVALWMLGIVVQIVRYYHWDWQWPPPPPELFSNALQAIAVGYLVASLAVIHLRLTGQIVLFAALTIGYWALMMFVPYNGNPGGTLQQYNNFAWHIDQIVLDVFRRHHSFTWIVSSLGFSASVLLGALAGRLMQARLTAMGRLGCLVAIGVGCLAVGWVWSYSIPLNRHLWTSSMVLWAGGWSFLLLAAFHAVIDLGGFRRWAFPFIVIGANALLAYVLDPGFERIGKNIAWFVHQKGWESAEPLLDLLGATCEIATLWLLLWWLYRRRWHFRA